MFKFPPNLIRIILICILFIGANLKVVAQIDMNQISIDETIKKQPFFSIYGDNYFIVGSPTNQPPSSLNSNIKFEIGFKQRLSNLVLPFKTYGYMTYRQKSFWHVFQESAPFTETNYNPGLGLAKPIVNEQNEITQAYFLQFQHQSNGRDSIYSRSWNFLSLEYILMHKENWQFGLKVWSKLGPLSDNRDLLDFIGHQETRIGYMPNPRLILEAKIRKTLKFDWKGSLEMSLSFKLDKNSNQYLYVQYFLGYGESLIEYNQNKSMIRIGVTLKDLFGNFAKYAQ